MFPCSRIQGQTDGDVWFKRKFGGRTDGWSYWQADKRSDLQIDKHNEEIDRTTEK